jgi:hypothetical protein
VRFRGKPGGGPRGVLQAAAIATLLVATRAALADPTPPPVPPDPMAHWPPHVELPAPVFNRCAPAGKPWADGLDPHRYELAGFPIVGGNSDIGVQFGGAATLTRFCDGVKPYLWNLDLLLSASAKDDANGLRLVQQSHVLRLDAPDLANGKMRLDGRASFQRTINEGYYGIGNGSSAALPPATTSIGRAFQYLQQEGRARFIVRVRTRTPWDIAFGANLRYEAPSAYAGTRLAFDGSRQLPDGTPFLRGVDPAALGGLAAGVFYDTRDSEFITTHGALYQIGVGGTVGSADGIGYGNASAVLSNYARLWPKSPFIFASRFVASAAVGNVPFYDLQQAGTFEPQYLFGGETGVRGVPNGRYAGKVMIVTNLEIRTPLPRFHLLGQRFRIGVVAFLDAGRVWADYRYDPALDGYKLDLKYGIGGGLFLQWGEAAIFRLEAAYSPDAVSENPSFPVGLYVSDGLMF